jgi:hypothetical protein
MLTQTLVKVFFEIEDAAALYKFRSRAAAAHHRQGLSCQTCVARRIGRVQASIWIHLNGGDSDLQIHRQQPQYVKRIVLTLRERMLVVKTSTM